MFQFSLLLGELEPESEPEGNQEKYIPVYSGCTSIKYIQPKSEQFSCFEKKKKKRRPVEAGSKGRNRGKWLISPSEEEFFLNKVWNALLCFIICSLNLIFKFTNRAQRKRRKEESAQEPGTYVRPRPKRMD